MFLYLYASGGLSDSLCRHNKEQYFSIGGKSTAPAKAEIEKAAPNSHFMASGQPPDITASA
ncbi:hypothetical protein [Paenibacillus silagei]|uniref:hypothetical protein n=1 Tax=Paenibacillus silagei TaxID=1670801 RepID=UPI001AE1A69C|nr:hypothetical protein [Paenibacillus silagei]